MNTNLTAPSTATEEILIGNKMAFYLRAAQDARRMGGRSAAGFGRLAAEAAEQLEELRARAAAV